MTSLREVMSEVQQAIGRRNFTPSLQYPKAVTVVGYGRGESPCPGGLSRPAGTFRAEVCRVSASPLVGRCRFANGLQRSLPLIGVW